MIASSIHEIILPPSITTEIKRCVDIFHAKKFTKSGWLQKGQSWNGVDDLVGELTGYELFYIDKASKEKGAGGWCDVQGERIALDFEDPGKISMLCHEIGHALQARAGIYSDNCSLLSDSVKYEQQCETIGANLYHALPFIKTETRKWDCYFKKEDIVFLADWYAGWKENDLKLSK